MHIAKVQKVFAFTMLMAAGCGGTQDGRAGGDGTTPGGGEARNVALEHRSCDSAGGQLASVDVNNDGRPDISEARDGGRLLCSEYDINFDGRSDAVRFFQSDGRTPSREDHDFDFDGHFDQIAYFSAAGVLERKEIDTNFDSRVDAWMWCEAGRVARAERDRHHRGRADTWEDYRQGLLAAARYDDNNDGRPEKWEAFRNGRLHQVQYDSDGDGQPDRTEEVSSSGASPADEPVSCDGRDLPAPTPETDVAPAVVSPPPSDGAGEGEASAPEAPAVESPATPSSGGEDWDDE